MTNAEKEMLEFLTCKDALPHVLEILRRGDGIEKRVLMQFWKELERRVRGDATAPIAPDGPMKLEIVVDDDPWEIELDFSDARLEETAEEYLDYTIFFICGDGSAELCYGVQWQNYFKDVRPKLKKLAAVVELMEKLDEMGFDKPRRGCSLAGGGAVDVGNTYDFLASIATGDGESVLQEVSANFCALVKKTRNLVVSANQDIVAAGRK